MLQADPGAMEFNFQEYKADMSGGYAIPLEAARGDSY